MKDETFLRQKAYSVIQSKLLEGELRAGDVISEQSLAQEIGMSRTPVREAIGQLQSEGLFYKVPRVGTIVRLPDRHELDDLYKVREALESFAAAQACDLLTDADLALLERLQQDLLAIVAELQAHPSDEIDVTLQRRFFTIDIAFHFVLIRATGNSHASKIVNEFRVVQRVFEYARKLHGQAIITTAAAQHGEILEALKRRDREAARIAMGNHIHTSRESALVGFEPQTDNIAFTLPDEIQHYIEQASQATNPLSVATH